MSAKGDYYPAGVNMYVPNMSYAADAEGLGGMLYADLGVHATASATNLLNAQSIASAGNTSTFANFLTEANILAGFGKFGRAVQAVASGAATSTVTITGFDYLGQAMVEVLTLNGTTPVLGKKAFRRVTNVAWGLTGGTTINVGTVDILGIPYANMSATVSECISFTDNVRDATQGTFTAYVATQTTTSGDPRGTMAPNAGVASNGTRRHFVQFIPFHTNLYGARHVTS